MVVFFFRLGEFKELAELPFGLLFLRCNPSVKPTIQEFFCHRELEVSLFIEGIG